MRKGPVHVSISIVVQKTPVNGTLAATAVPVTLRFHSIWWFFRFEAHPGNFAEFPACHFPAFSIFAHVSRSDTVRLKTGFPGLESKSTAK